MEYTYTVQRFGDSYKIVVAGEIANVPFTSPEKANKMAEMMANNMANLIGGTVKFGFYMDEENDQHAFWQAATV